MSTLRALLALAFGTALWVPLALLLHGISGLGVGASGWEMLATLAPPTLIYSPSIFRSIANGKFEIACSSFAATPVLAVAGAACMFTLEATIFRSFAHHMQQIVSSLSVVAIFTALAIALRLMENNESSSKRDA